MKEARHKRAHSMISLIQNSEKDKTRAKERRSEVAGDQGVSVGNWLQKGRRDSFAVMEMFNMAIVVLVTQYIHLSKLIETYINNR